MTVQNEERSTYHASNGKFTNSRSAHSVTRGGQRYKMVRQLRAMKMHQAVTRAEDEPKNDDVIETLAHARAMASVAMLLSASPGWIPIHDILGRPL